MPFAEEGLYNIQDYIFSKSKDSETAVRMVRRIVAYANNNLSYNPFIGRIISEYKLKTKNVRRITTTDKRYNIYYSVNEQAREVYILKIVDGRQSVERQLSGL